VPWKLVLTFTGEGHNEAAYDLADELKAVAQRGGGVLVRTGITDLATGTTTTVVHSAAGTAHHDHHRAASAATDDNHDSSAAAASSGSDRV
jgi:hypothetical protein